MGSFVYLSCALPELWSLKKQKWLIFLFSADGSKKSVTVWAIYLSASERSYLALSKNARDCWLLSYH